MPPEKFSLSDVYDQRVTFRERKISERKWFWTGEQNCPSREWCVSVCECWLAIRGLSLKYWRHSNTSHELKQNLPQVTRAFTHPRFSSYLSYFQVSFTLFYCPRRLSFTWWGCCGLCFWHTLSKLAHSFLFCSCVCFYLYGAFNCISFSKFSRQLSTYSLCSSGLISICFTGPFNYMYISLSLKKFCFSRLWMTGFKAPSNQLVLLSICLLSRRKGRGKADRK